LRRRALPIAGVTLLLLVLVLIPGIGHMAGGARRWLQVGSFGLQIGEIAKLAVVVMLAASLAKRRGDRAIVAHLAFPCVAAGLLLLEPDFGTAVLVMTISFVMLFVGGARIGVLAGIVLLALPAGIIAISTSAYRMRRVLAFLDPWAHRYDIGYQVTESLMTIGSGGAMGAGLGESKQKLFFLPAAHTDFIFAVIGEELGFIGVMFVLGMFVTIGARALKASLTSKDTFVSLLVLGLASVLIVQAMLNIAVVLGLVPTKGITLPFVSAGGSSLLVSLFIAGILMRATQDALQTSPNRRSAVPLRAGVILRGAET
jgi:cell division protein FtsW